MYILSISEHTRYTQGILKVYTRYTQGNISISFFDSNNYDSMDIGPGNIMTLLRGITFLMVTERGTILIKSLKYRIFTLLIKSSIPLSNTKSLAE